MKPPNDGVPEPTESLSEMVIVIFTQNDLLISPTCHDVRNNRPFWCETSFICISISWNRSSKGLSLPTQGCLKEARALGSGGSSLGRELPTNSSAVKRNGVLTSVSGCTYRLIPTDWSWETDDDEYRWRYLLWLTLNSSTFVYLTFPSRSGILSKQ